MKDKQISAGILIETNDGYLACHPTLKPKKKGFWDIPKGHIEDGEQAKEAMLRELLEETGIVLKDTSNLKDFGTFPYTKYKDLYIFYTYIANQPIILSNLKCVSKFEMNGKIMPEMNDYLITKDLDYFYPKLRPILHTIVGSNQS